MENITRDKLTNNIIYLVKENKLRPNKLFTLKELIHSEIGKALKQGIKY